MQRELPPEIKPESEITFYFGVQDVIDREKIGDFMRGLRTNSWWPILLPSAST